jgi:hypothetical protein
VRFNGGLDGGWINAAFLQDPCSQTILMKQCQQKVFGL